MLAPSRALRAWRALSVARSLATKSSSAEVVQWPESRYVNALHPDLVALLERIKEDDDGLPPALAVGLPHSNLILLRRPDTGHKVLLYSVKRGKAPFLGARQAGAVVRLTQPSFIGLQILHGFGRFLAGEVDATQDSAPAGVDAGVWGTYKTLYAFKQQKMELLATWRPRLDRVLSPAMRTRVTRLLQLTEEILRLPVMQDDVINLEAGTVNTTHGFRLGGGFDQIPKDPSRGPLETFLRKLLHVPFQLTGRGEVFEPDAEYRLVMAEAAAKTMFVHLYPAPDVVQRFVNAHQIKSFRYSTPLQIMDAQRIGRKLVAAGEAPPLPEGLDTSLMDQEQLAYWRLELATMVGLVDIHPLAVQVHEWEGHEMCDALLAATEALAHGTRVAGAVGAPGPGKLGLVVVNEAVVPSFVRRWVYSLPELIQAKEAGEFQAREEALRAEAEAEARAVAAAAEARPGGPRRGRKRKRR